MPSSAGGLGGFIRESIAWSVGVPDSIKRLDNSIDTVDGALKHDDQVIETSHVGVEGTAAYSALGADWETIFVDSHAPRIRVSAAV